MNVGTKVKTIIFDLNQTIVTYDNQVSLDIYFKELLGVGVLEFEKIKRENFNPYLFGEISQKEYHRLALEKLTLKNISVEESIALDNSRFELIKGMKQILNNLIHDYKIILLAGDGKESLSFKLSFFKLKEYFDSIYCSCFEKLLKNNKKFYELVLEKEQLIPEETLFIDDHKEYIEIVESLGMDGIHFKGVDDLKLKLKEFDVLV